jgi:hypothetical protein
MISLQKNNVFVTPAKCSEALEQYKREVNSARTFLEDNYIYDPQFYGAPFAELYDMYRNGHQ